MTAERKYTPEELDWLLGSQEPRSAQEERERFVASLGGPRQKTSKHEGREGSFPGKKRGRVKGDARHH